MLKFKKTCFSCGAKVDSLIESRCEECYRTEFPSIKEIKPITLKYCNSCNKIHIGNQFVEREKFEERLLPMIKKNISLNEKYELEDISISNLKIQGPKVLFDIEINTKLNN